MKNRYDQCKNSVKMLFVFVFSVIFLLAFFSSAKALVIYELFDNTNLAAVYNGPTQPTQFTINDYYEITEIETYHWNNARGKTPGRIQIVHNDGTVYGPWQATGREGYMDVPNAYWQVHPYEVIKPGTYTIQVSDNASWSYNSQSGNRGHAKVYGVLSSEESTETDADKIFNYVEDLDLGDDIFVPRRQETQCFYTEGYELCFRQYTNYYGYELYLVTYQGNFWLLLGEYTYLGTVQEWVTTIDQTLQPAGLDGTWKRDDGLVIEISGDKAYFVSYGSSSWATIASQGLVSTGDLKMTNISRVADYEWAHNDLWWFRSSGEYKLQWSDKTKSSITMRQDGDTLDVKTVAMSPFDNSYQSSSTSVYTRQ